MEKEKQIKAPVRMGKKCLVIKTQNRLFTKGLGINLQANIKLALVRQISLIWRGENLHNF